MFALILVVMIVSIAVAALAERRNIQPPLLLAIIGLGASYLPGLPKLELEPHIILGIVLPPMLFSAASDFSFSSFARRAGSIINLGVFLVFAVTVVVGIAATIVLPGIPPAAALVLGAVLAPPDAVAAITIGRKAGLPTALMTVLKGESLINDAAALTLFAATIAAVAGTHPFIDGIGQSFLYAALVGSLVGALIGNLAQFVRGKLGNPSLATAVSVVIPFAVYLLAEELHASGVLAVVAAGFSMGHHATSAGYEERIQERQFWRTADTLLETFVFAYIGLQLRFVLEDATAAGYQLSTLLGATVAIFVATVLVRFGWIFVTAALGRWRYKRIIEKNALHAPRRRGRTPPPPSPPLSWKENIVLSWTGMRGVVTLAAAAGIPLVTATGEDFPGREAILALAFLVTIATLLIHGLTLPWLIRRLDIANPDDARYEAEQRSLARQIAQKANKETLEAYRAAHDNPDDRTMIDLIASRFNRESENQKSAENFDRTLALDLGNLLLNARRTSLLAARDARQLDDAVLRDMLEQMDTEQAFMDTMGNRARDAKAEAEN